MSKASIEKKLRSSIAKIINEDDQFRLNRDLLKITLRLTMHDEAHVPDTLTRIRVLPMIAVVGQTEKVVRDKDKKAVLEIYVKFLPTDGSIFSNLKSVGKLIKALPGVKFVRVLTVSGRSVLHKNKPIVI